jgi:hypothetical protein
MFAVMPLIGGLRKAGKVENLLKSFFLGCSGKAPDGSGRMRSLLTHCYLEYKMLFGTCGVVAISPNVATGGFPAAACHYGF